MLLEHSLISDCVCFIAVHTLVLQKSKYYNLNWLSEQFGPGHIVLSVSITKANDLRSSIVLNIKMQLIMQPCCWGLIL